MTTEAAYLFATGADEYHAPLRQLCRGIIDTMLEHFGTFLFIEVWATHESATSEPPDDPLPPAFEIVASDASVIPTTIDTLQNALAEMTLGRQPPHVTVRHAEHVAPPGMEPLIDGFTEGTEGCVVLGLAVRPVYRDDRTSTLFPMLLQTLRSQLAWVLRKTISQFVGRATKKALDDTTLGPTSFAKATQLVDQQLCEVSDSFDFLLQVTPTNVEQSWREFCERGFKHEPAFYYRPLPYRPNLLKRRLFDIEIERVEDSTLSHLFWEKQDEIDRQLSALRDLDGPQFLRSSLQLYGEADDALVRLAEAILGRRPKASGESGARKHLSVNSVVKLARKEIDHYQRQMRDFRASIQVCDHIAAGMMVSKDTLLIARTLHVTAESIMPLLHHEVGTHLLTYFNGRAQPFRQMYAGLAGYDELQEGLAVLAEYLTGGLSIHRMHILAGRVIAVRSMTDGIGFAETFARLHEEYGFSLRQAFTTTVRAYRGGGLTKDVIYLRGLRNLLEFIADGRDIEPLYVGKMGLQHLPYVQEMRRRGIIHAPSVLPRYWSDAAFVHRLKACRGRSAPELLEIAQ